MLLRLNLSDVSLTFLLRQFNNIPVRGMCNALNLTKWDVATAKQEAAIK